VVQGEIDHANMQDFARAVEAAPRCEGSGSVLVDMADVDYIDSGGLSVVYSVLHALPAGSILGVIAPQASIVRILQIGGITGHQSFRMFENRPQACESVSLAAGS
jgi:anti-anti-sigma factor